MKGDQPLEKPSRSVPYYKENNSGKKTKSVSPAGCLIFLGIFLFVGFHFAADIPGFLAYRNKARRESVKPFLEKAVVALEDYSQKAPDNLYPERIDNSGDLVKLIQQAGLTIDRMESLSLIEKCIYHSIDRKGYFLIAKVKYNDSYPYILSPSGIIEVIEFSQLSDTLLAAVVQTLFSMDQALKERKFQKYIAYYSSKATLHIENIYHLGVPTDPKNRLIKNTIDQDLESRAWFQHRPRPLSRHLQIIFGPYRIIHILK